MYYSLIWFTERKWFFNCRSQTVTRSKIKKKTRQQWKQNEIDAMTLMLLPSNVLDAINESFDNAVSEFFKEHQMIFSIPSKCIFKSAIK